MDQTTPIVCEKCGGEVFQEGLMLRKVSKIITATAQDSLLPIGTFFCVACGHVNKDFKPEQLSSPQ
jgi:uncharacterized Zn finger protein